MKGLFAREPFKRVKENSVAWHILKTIENQLQAIEAKLNEIKEARFIVSATSTALDHHGFKLGLPRNAGEDDDTYRARLLAAFRDVSKCLTYQSIKDAVKPHNLDQVPTIYEYHEMLAGFPFLWGDKILGNLSQRILVELQEGAAYDTIRQVLQGIVLATVEPRLVINRGTYFEEVQ